MLIQDTIEILTNFWLITTHFGDHMIDMVANTSFMVNLTNAYCLLRKIKKFWLPDENRYVTLRISTRGMRVIDKKGITRVVKDLRAKGVKV